MLQPESYLSFPLFCHLQKCPWYKEHSFYCSARCRDNFSHGRESLALHFSSMAKDKSPDIWISLYRVYQSLTYVRVMFNAIYARRKQYTHKPPQRDEHERMDRRTDVDVLTAVVLFLFFFLKDQSRRRKKVGPSQFLLGPSVCGRSFNGARIWQSHYHVSRDRHVPFRRNKTNIIWL